VAGLCDHGNKPTSLIRGG